MTQPFAVIIAGGRGERFWPQSRARRPKHLLAIVGEKPMLTQTVERVRPLVSAENTFVITSALQAKAVREVCAAAGIPAANVVAEPVGRDTAAAVALAAALVAQRDPTGVFAVLPADHVIKDEAAYREDLRVAFAVAQEKPVIVTIGIKPNEPATGFGYIKKGAGDGAYFGCETFVAEAFCEKPDLETAIVYVATGSYLWNAGMFIWSVPVVTAGLKQHAPALYEGLAPVRSALEKNLPLMPALARAYRKLEKISIDYALLEKSRNVVVIPARFDWDDVGAWPALARHNAQDAQGNVLRGRVFVEQGKNNIVVSHDKHLLAVVGADDLVVVHTKDATLVCPKNRVQDIKALLKRIEAESGGRRWL